MLKVLEGIFGMHLNRFWLFVLALIFGYGALGVAPAIAASKDKEKQTQAQTKTTKVVVKSPKRPKTVRVTVTRSTAPAVAGPPSLATALGLRGQHDDLSLLHGIVDSKHFGNLRRFLLEFLSSRQVLQSARKAVFLAEDGGERRNAFRPVIQHFMLVPGEPLDQTDQVISLERVQFGGRKDVGVR